MANYDSGMMNSIFSSLGRNNSFGSMAGIYSNLGEYNNIKSGNFYRAAKKYYLQKASDKTEDKTDSKKNTDRTDIFKDAFNNTSSLSISRDSTKELALIDDSSERLMNSSKALVDKSSSSLFAQKDGKYDVDKIYSAVNDFVKSYNDVIDSTSDSATTSITSAAARLQNKTAFNSSKLSSLGITIGEDKKLTINEEAFKSADMETVKKLFNGNGSYGYQVEVNAGMIQSSAELEASRSNTYNDFGVYSNNNNMGNIYTDFF